MNVRNGWAWKSSIETLPTIQLQVNCPPPPLRMCLRFTFAPNAVYDSPKSTILEMWINVYDSPTSTILELDQSGISTILKSLQFPKFCSASIRSASKFCFDLDGRKNFQLFQKIFFRSIQSWGHDFFGEISNPQGGGGRVSIQPNRPRLGRAKFLVKTCRLLLVFVGFCWFLSAFVGFYFCHLTWALFCPFFVGLCRFYFCHLTWALFCPFFLSVFCWLLFLPSYIRDVHRPFPDGGDCPTLSPPSVPPTLQKVPPTVGESPLIFSPKKSPSQ